METAEAEGERDADARDCETTGEHGIRGYGHFVAKAAHLPHVVGVDSVNYRAGAEEEEALKEGVRDEMEQAGDPAAEAEGEHHEAELADGRVSEDAFDSTAVRAIEAARISVMQPIVAMTSSASGERSG